MRVRSIMVLVAALALGAGCLESNPQPSPIDEGGVDAAGGDPASTRAEVDEEKILVSAANVEGDLATVGMIGAAPGADYAEAWSAEPDDDSDQDGEGFDVDKNGGFGGVVPTVAGRDIVIAFHYPEGFEPPVVKIRLKVPEVAQADTATPWVAYKDANEEPQNGGSYVPEGFWSELDGDEHALDISVTVDGDNATVVGGPWVTTPLSLVSAVAPATGGYGTTQADTTGGFALSIAAGSGDEILLFASNPEDHEKSTDPLTLIVP